MSSTISELRKKSHTKFHTRIPVLLTVEFKKQVERLIHFAINNDIKICTRVGIISPNGIKISEEFTLSPDQILQVWQIKPRTVTLSLNPPEHLKEHLSEVFKVDVGINGLFIDKIEANDILRLTEATDFPKERKNQAATKIHLKNNPHRPSNNGKSKSQRIQVDLEEILIENKIINPSVDTLWNALLERTEAKPESYFKKIKNNKIQDKETKKIWDRESTSYHINKVLKWYNSSK